MNQAYIRYMHVGAANYGILDGDVIHQLSGDFLTGANRTGKTLQLADVRLLPPVQPPKVIAIGLNYRSHLGERPARPYPGIFTKLTTSIIATEDAIVYPPDAEALHYEGEMVVVMGKRVKDVTEAEVADCIFGITCGNDVSERVWQKNDLQWFRAKGADTFGPLGPAVVQGLNYDDLQVTTRLNGEVRQSQRTKDLLFSVASLVSYISRYATLLPGDVIYTGTPGTTGPMKPGDVVEVEVEGVGILRNRVVASR